MAHQKARDDQETPVTVVTTLPAIIPSVKRADSTNAVSASIRLADFEQFSASLSSSDIFHRYT